MLKATRLTLAIDENLVVLFFFLSNNFRAVVETAAFANFVRFVKLVAMRAFYERSRRCLVVCESLVRSALGLFTLRYCHLNTSILILFS